MNKLSKTIIFVLSPMILSSCAIFSPVSSGGESTTSKSSSQPIVQGLAVYRNDTGALIENGSTIEVETYYDFYLTFKISGSETTNVTISSSDGTVINTHSRSFYPYKEGSSTITVTNKADTTKKITFTVNAVTHGDLSSIYLGNEGRGLKIEDDNSATITGRVFAEFENGLVRTINGDERLTITSEEGKSKDYRNVTLSYSLGGKTKSVTYEASKLNPNIVEKTELKQNYQTYSDNGYYRNYPDIQSSGDVNILAIPVWFADSSSYFDDSMKDVNGKGQKEQIREDLEEALFSTPKRKSDQSLKSYYQCESSGTLKIDGKVSSWYETSYTSSTNYMTDKTARESILKNAWDWYKENNPLDATEYDCVILCYGSNHYGDESNKYSAFATSVYDTKYPELCKYIYLPASRLYGTPTKEEMLSINDLSDMGYNDSIDSDSIIHEFAHTMGANDIYGDSRVSGIYSTPSGHYSMQSSDVCAHDSRTLMTMGWSSPYILDSSKISQSNFTLEIDDMQSSTDCIILTPSWNEYDSPFDEYVVIELFSGIGMNTFGVNTSNATGLRVYHIESRLYDFKTASLTADATTSGAVLPFTNTYGAATAETTHPELSKYDTMDLVHLIRKNTVDSKGNEIGYLTTDNGWTQSWFTEGDTFTMDKYGKQFYVEGKLDEGQDLGWSFEVLSIEKNEHGGAHAKISFVKE